MKARHGNHDLNVFFQTKAYQCNSLTLLAIHFFEETFTNFIQKFSADEKSFKKEVLLKSLTSIKKVGKTYFHVCVYAIRKAESEIKNIYSV